MQNFNTMKRLISRTAKSLLALVLLAPVSVVAQMQGDMPVRAEFNARVENATNMAGERILLAKERAEEEINRRIDGLNKLLERVTAMKRVTESLKGSLRTTVDAQLQNIEALRARILSATDISTLRDDIQSITRSYRIFALVMPQAQIAAAADRIITMTAMMGEIGVKLGDRIDTAASEGEDVVQLEVWLENLSLNIDAANAHAQAAVDGTANLKPDDGDNAVAEANRLALQQAREELRLAHEEVQAGRETIRNIIDGLKNEEVSVEQNTTLE